MAKAKVDEVVESALVEVEYILDGKNTSVHVAGTIVSFENGKANVKPEVAKALKEAALIK